VATDKASTKDLAEDPRWQLVERVVASASFQRSWRLRELLLFVCERTLKDPDGNVRESDVAAGVFGRADDFDTNVDTLVRVQASQLRKKLQQYFSSEGVAEPLLLEIPRGTYRPVFRERGAGVKVEAAPEEPEADLDADEAEQGVLRSRLPPRTVKLLWKAAALACVAALGLASYRMISAARAQAAAARPVLVWREAEGGIVAAPMEVRSDPKASGHYYVEVAAGNESQSIAPASGHVDIRFSLPQAGTYKVWARVITPTDTDDSLWVKMDGSTWFNWNQIPLGAEWHWDDVHEIAGASSTPVTWSLTAGPHTLTIAYREDGARIDRVLITNDEHVVPAGTGPAGPVQLWPEAEDAAITEPLRVERDVGASGSACVAVSPGHESQTAPPAEGHLTVRFDIPAAGEYRVWGRVIAPTLADDSFWVRMDDGPWYNWNQIPLGDVWHWDDVHDSSHASVALTWSLKPGAHTLTLAYREDGVALDRLLVTADPTFVPVGPGPQAEAP
jgi:hypothetical protein